MPPVSAAVSRTVDRQLEASHPVLRPSLTPLGCSVDHRRYVGTGARRTARWGVSGNCRRREESVPTVREHERDGIDRRAGDAPPTDAAVVRPKQPGIATPRPREYIPMTGVVEAELPTGAAAARQPGDPPGTATVHRPFDRPRMRIDRVNRRIEELFAVQDGADPAMPLVDELHLINAIDDLTVERFDGLASDVLPLAVDPPTRRRR